MHIRPTRFSSNCIKVSKKMITAFTEIDLGFSFFWYLDSKLAKKPYFQILTNKSWKLQKSLVPSVVTSFTPDPGHGEHYFASQHLQNNNHTLSFASQNIERESCASFRIILSCQMTDVRCTTVNTRLRRIKGFLSTVFHFTKPRRVRRRTTKAWVDFVDRTIGRTLFLLNV